MTKKCCKCKLIFSFTYFGKLKSSPDGYRYDCKNCRKNYRESNKEQIQIKQKEFYEINKDKLLQKNKLYRLENQNKINEKRKEYRNRPEIKEHIKNKNIEYLPIRKENIKLKRQTDLHFQISEILRSKIHKMIKNKKTTYKNIIGCDLEFLKKWLEFRFDENMSWNNLGKIWQIDHILPISKFDFNNEQDINICFHWTNLQPLLCLENKSKSNKFELYHYFNNIVNINRFNTKYTNFLGYQTLNESLKWLRNKKLRYGKNAPYDLDKSNEIDNPQPSS
jgi:hypothetical protein